MKNWFICSILILCPFPVFAQSDPQQPKPIPSTREEMKKALEKLKTVQPRIPFPKLTSEQTKKPLVNNGIMRQYYLSNTLKDSGFSRTPEPGMLLDPTFKIMLFWIVSRSNNCHYCLGHQEAKLHNAGLEEERIAALDFDWEAYSEAEQIAFRFTKLLALEPQNITDEEYSRLQKYFTPTQILEIVLSVASFTAMNRWTDSLGIPQEANPMNLKTPTFLTETPSKYLNKKSKVCPLANLKREELPSSAEVKSNWQAALKRSPRIPLMDMEKARERLQIQDQKDPLPNYAILLAYFPRMGKSKMNSILGEESKGLLAPKTRFQIRWVAARHDRAWYALAQATSSLKALGQSDAQIFALDKATDGFSEAEKTLFSFVRKLTVQPFLISDSDIANLRKYYSDFEVAEIVQRIANAAYFDRLTETIRLPIEANVYKNIGLD